jgi:hypothetical protein
MGFTEMHYWHVFNCSRSRARRNATLCPTNEPNIAGALDSSILLRGAGGRPVWSETSLFFQNFIEMYLNFKFHELFTNLKLKKKISVFEGK